MPKIDELIKREVSKEIYQRFKDKIITITKVKVSPDLSFAKVWISGIGDLSELVALIQSEASEVQGEIASRVRFKKMPRLTFVPDFTREHATRIDELIEEIHEKDKS